MKKELFSELLESANQALEHARGKLKLRTTLLPKPPAAPIKEAATQVRADHTAANKNPE